MKFTPIYGVNQLIEMLNKGGTITDDMVLIIETYPHYDPKPFDIIERCINLFCSSTQLLQVLDLISSGRIVAFTGYIYMGKEKIEQVTLEEFVQEQVNYGRDKEFATSVSISCSHVIDRYNKYKTDLFTSHHNNTTRSIIPCVSIECLSQFEYEHE